jgi:hypothetical protein
MGKPARVLVAGLDPAVVDFSRAPVPGLTFETLTAMLKADVAALEADGHSVRLCHLDTGETAEAVFAAALRETTYDCVLIGAGVRAAPHHFLLFERLINVLHANAPASTKICFNTRPNDTAEAVRRWV